MTAEWVVKLSVEGLGRRSQSMLLHGIRECHARALHTSLDLESFWGEQRLC